MTKKRRNNSFNNKKNVRYNELFNDSQEDDSNQNYDKIKKKRKRSLDNSVESSDKNFEELTGEFGFVAPIPVSAFTDNINSIFLDNDFKDMVNGSSDDKDEDEDDYENNEESINRILQSLNDSSDNDVKTDDDVKIYKLTSEKVKKEKSPENPQTPVKEVLEEVRSKKKKKVAKTSEITESKEVVRQKSDEEKQLPIVDKFPAIRDSRQYRSRILPVNIVDVPSLQKILSSEIKKMKKDVKEVNSPSRSNVSALYDNIEDDDSDNIDYSNTTEFRRISSSIRKNIQSAYFNIFLISFLSAILFFITSVNEQSFVTGNTSGNPVPYLISSLAIVAIATISSIKPIIKGISSLFTIRPNADSAMAISCISIIIHTSVAFNFQPQILDGSIHVYPFVALLSILFNHIGKVVALNRRNSNLRFVTSNEDKYAVRIIGNHGLSRDFAGDSVYGLPIIAYQKKTNGLQNFLKIAKEPDPSEVSSKNMTFLFLIGSLLIGVLQAIISQDPFKGFSIFVVSICVSSAIGNILCVNLVMSRLSRKLRSSGAMINSYYPISELAKVNAISLTASDLFPQGNIHVTAAKTYGSEDPETVLLYAGILANEAGGTYKDIFSQFIREDETKSLKIDSMFFEDGNGISGEINRSTILIGNRDLMIKNNVEPPPKEEVIEYTGRGEKVLFIALDGVFSAMLVLRYTIDRKKIIALKDLENRGISIIVKSNDSNITQKMLSTSFGLYKSSINVLSGQIGEKYEKMIKQPLQKTDALVATKGKTEAMVEIIKDCDIQKKMVSLLVALQCTGSILGFALVALLSFSGSITQLTALSISLYQLFWLLITIFVPKAKKM